MVGEDGEELDSSDKGKRKGKKRMSSENLDESSEAESSKKSTKRRRHGDTSDGERRVKKKRVADDSEDHTSDDEHALAKNKRKTAVLTSDTETDSSPRRHLSSARKRSSSPALHLVEENFTSAYVYRAIRQERVALGWSQAPCGKCPVFDFCKDKGPVNPQECNYFEGWLEGGVAGAE
jgi:DNA-directed RNA polymerase III subunit RPC6